MAKKRWNLVDYTLVALLLALVACVAFGLWRRSLSGAAPVQAWHCVLQTQPMDSAQADPASVAPVAGAGVFSATGESIGTVVSVTQVPWKTVVAQNGQPVLREREGWYRLEVTVHLRLSDPPTVGAARLAAGGRLDLILDRLFAAGCEIVSMEVEADAE